MFQGLRANSILYILEKGEALQLKIGHVISVSNPQPRYAQNTQMPAYLSQPDMVVDIKAKVGEEVLEFKQLSANASITNSGNIVVSDSKDAMNNEVEGLLRSSKQVIESVPYHEKNITMCDTILRELNPHFAKEKEQEEKIGLLESKMENIEGTLHNMMGMLTKALNKSTSKNNKEE